MEVVGRQIDAILAARDGRRSEEGRDRLRARLGHRHRQGRDPEQAQEVHAFIRSEIAKKHGQAVADVLRILYGGSVKPTTSRPDGPARRRRRPGRRRFAQGRLVPEARALRPADRPRLTE
jgi:hypothetical protein